MLQIFSPSLFPAPVSSLCLSLSRSLSLSLSVALSLVVHALVHSGESYWQRGR